LMTGNVGGRRATVDQILWSLVLHALVNSHPALVLDPLRNVQPVQLSVK